MVETAAVTRPLYLLESAGLRESTSAISANDRRAGGRGTRNPGRARATLTAATLASSTWLKTGGRPAVPPGILAGISATASRQCSRVGAGHSGARAVIDDLEARRCASRGHPAACTVALSARPPRAGLIDSARTPSTLAPRWDVPVDWILCEVLREVGE